MSNLLTLVLIWLLSGISDRLWFAFDRSVPAWDQADYLTNSLNYWRIFQDPQWFSSQWWEQMWMLSPKVPPLTYILTVPFLNVFGIGPSQATLVHLFFNGILLASVYGIAIRLFNRQVAVWACIISVLLPGLYVYRLQYLIDYPIAVMVALCFCCLTQWKFSQKKWVWAIAFGLSFGLALLVKQTALFFLFIPLVWVSVDIIKHRRWNPLAQLITALLLTGIILIPWVTTNWLLMLTSGKRATIDSAIAEGDPALNTLEAWTYYWNLLPYHISWLWLIIPIVGFILYFIYPKPASKPINFTALKWLAIFWVGGYFLCSLNINKDFRYSLPLLPISAIFLAYGLTLLSQRWGKRVRQITLGFAIVLMLLNMWPIGGVWGRRMAAWVSPGGDRIAHLKPEWPHKQVINEIIETEPYLQSTLGVLPSTPNINQHNFNYYGALRDEQVYGRQVGTRLDHVGQDSLSLSWFVTKTGQQGMVERIGEAQVAIVREIEQGRQFQLHKRWLLPDNTVLNLYHRQTPYIEVSPQPNASEQVQLTQVIVSPKVSPNTPIPIIYVWSGSWEQLKSGLVILTWKLQTPSTAEGSSKGSSQWLHDHAIASGTLHSATQTNNSGFQVLERMGMLPPEDIIPGVYRLEATYLNRETGQTYAIAMPPVTFEIDPKAAPLPAPELDLVSQLRRLARNLPEGIPGLEPVFDEVGRINQYDPVQDYTIQAEKTLSYRLQTEPENLQYAYSLALANVLQQDAPQAITALEQVIQLDPQNPNAYAYLAFVHLYALQPRQAEQAIQTAIQLNRDQSEFQALRGVSALMQGNLIQAWRDLQVLGDGTR
ncbi:MAG: phospholipid carrier-dependent glycosyltransferase [Cyanobacteria bacterium J06592_8]